MSFSTIPAGKDLPNDIYVVIEIPAESSPVKYEIEKEHDAVFVDRFMTAPMFYPANYGYINNTLADDGDALVNQIKHFFENYKTLEDGKWVKVEGWDNADAARKAIEVSAEAYNKANG